MPIKVKTHENEVWFDTLEKDDCKFYLVDDSGSHTKIEVPIDLDNSFKDKDFEVYFLAKKNVKESDIFKVHCKKNESRIGWIIPTLSLGSALHDLSNDAHFLKYAYIGIRESLKKIAIPYSPIAYPKIPKEFYILKYFMKKLFF